MEKLIELTLIATEYFAIGLLNWRFITPSKNKKYLLFLILNILTSIILFSLIEPIASAIYGFILLIISLYCSPNKFVGVISGTLYIASYILLNYLIGFGLTKLEIYDHLSIHQILAIVLLSYIFIGYVVAAKFKKFINTLTESKEIGWILSLLCVITLSSYYALILEEHYLEIHSYYVILCGDLCWCINYWCYFLNWDNQSIVKK